MAFDALNYANSTPPTGYANAPGNANCTSCHSGTALQTSGTIHNNITLTTSAPISALLPNTTYTFDLGFSNAASSKYGFQLLVLPTGATASTASLGTLVSTSTETELTTAGTRSYLAHSSTGTSAPSNTKTWTFDYTTPATISSPPVFYVVINSSNNNGSSGGDVIYAKTFASSILPVTWGDVTIYQKNSSPVLYWQTMCEINNQAFEVETSNDLMQWNTLGRIAAAGNSQTMKQYSFNLAGYGNAAFFRVKQIDFNGKSSYSKVVSLHKNGLQQENFSPAFIPSINAYQIPDLGFNTFMLHDSKGNKVITNITLVNGKLELSLGHLPKGIYLIQASTANEQFCWKLINY